ncbi:MULTISPECIES: hypothetical protein [Agrobacterium tumefaciens complex]|uniref:hypothetical protein n=1 Tax=Agrobacterium tumefaciens complex TaxID=1183400 RepID=UPI0009BBA20A|nr:MULTISPECIES: hypothetical protein [Agrobacterium tumefaciens complex]QCL88992.1 hypothetical protein CFBP6623_07485 [Agrobacterium tumefaciens]
MRFYHWLELVGKALVLIAVGGQLSILAAAQSLSNIVEAAAVHTKLDKIWYKLNYDQASGSEDVYHLKNIPWSWWDLKSWGHSLFHEAYGNIYFWLSLLFVVGSVLTLISRYFEIKASPNSQSS